jgi:hypothetical protein
MNDESPPVACSLGADDLRRRLEEIAALGSESLTGRDTDGETRVLRFRRAVGASKGSSPPSRSAVLSSPSTSTKRATSWC